MVSRYASDAVVLGCARFVEERSAGDPEVAARLDRACSILSAQLREPEGIFETDWSAAPESDEARFDLNLLYPLVAAWVHLAPSAAHDILTSALAAMQDDGGLPAVIDASGLVVDPSPARARLCHAFYLYQSATGDDGFVSAALPAMRSHVQHLLNADYPHREIAEAEARVYAKMSDPREADLLAGAPLLSPIELEPGTDIDDRPRDILWAVHVILAHIPKEPGRNAAPISPMVQWLNQRRRKLMVIALAGCTLFVAMGAILSVFRTKMTTAAVETTIGLARHYYTQRDYTQAERLFRDLLVRGSSVYAADHDLGKTLYQMGRYPEAAKYFESAIEKDSTFPAPAYDLALALYRDNKPEEAIASFDRFATHFKTAYPDLARQALLARELIQKAAAVEQPAKK